MGPPSYMRSIVERNVIMRRMTVISLDNNTLLTLLSFSSSFLAFFFLMTVFVPRCWMPCLWNKNTIRSQTRHTADATRNDINEIQVPSLCFKVTSLTIHFLHHYSGFIKSTWDIHRNCTKLVVMPFLLKLVSINFLSLKVVCTTGNIEQSDDTRSGERGGYPIF
jgi:hypothetical protein